MNDLTNFSDFVSTAEYKKLLKETFTEEEMSRIKIARKKKIKRMQNVITEKLAKQMIINLFP